MKKIRQFSVYLTLLILINSCAEVRHYPNYHTSKKEDISFKIPKHNIHHDFLGFLKHRKQSLPLIRTQEKTTEENLNLQCLWEVKRPEPAPYKPSIFTKTSTEPTRNVPKNQSQINSKNSSIIASMKENTKTVVKHPEKILEKWSKKENIASYSKMNYNNIIWTIIAVLAILYIVGLSAGNIGGLIHILLAVILILVLLNLLGFRTT